MIAEAQWLKIWVFSMEVPGSNTGKFFSTFPCTFFYPMVTVLSTLQFIVVRFLPCNSIAVNAFLLNHIRL